MLYVYILHLKDLLMDNFILFLNLKCSKQKNDRGKIHCTNRETAPAHDQCSNENFKGFKNIDVAASEIRIFILKSALGHAQPESHDVSTSSPNRHTGITQLEAPSDIASFEGNQVKVGVETPGKHRMPFLQNAIF